MSTAHRITPSTKQAQRHLSQKIRWAVEPDNPRLLQQFLQQKADTAGVSQARRRQHYLTQFILLLDTFSDDCLPPHWRRLCLNNIYQPLHALQRLADCQASQTQVLALKNELRIISHYFQVGLNNPVAVPQPQRATDPIRQPRSTVDGRI